MEVSDVSFATERQNILGATQVGFPRVAGSVGALEFQHRGPVNHPVAILPHPFGRTSTETKIWMDDVPFQANRARQFTAQFGFKPLQNRFHSFVSGFLLGASRDHRDAFAAHHGVAKQVLSDKTSCAGHQGVLMVANNHREQTTRGAKKATDGMSGGGDGRR